MKRLLIMLIAIIANVGLTQAQTTDKEERAKYSFQKQSIIIKAEDFRLGLQ